MARSNTLNRPTHGRILFVAGRELSYTRNDVLIRALRRNGYAVDTVGVLHPVHSISQTTVRLIPILAARLLAYHYDLIVIGFYGYLLMPVIKAFTRTPLLFDAFVSNYDTLCFDRQVIAPMSPFGRAIYQFDKHVCNGAHHVLLDTPQHMEYFVETFGLNARHVSWIPVGCNEDIFHPRPTQSHHDRTIVLHYSTFLPLHGVDVILHAAACLRTMPIQFRLIGEGPLLSAMKSLAADLQLTNVEFLPPASLTTIAEEIACAHICLGGHFGGSGKSQRVVPGKIYQMMTSRRAIIAADSPANRTLLTHEISALLTPAGNSEQLASAILRLHQNPALCASLATNAYRTFEAECSEQVITVRLSSIVAALLG